MDHRSSGGLDSSYLGMHVRYSSLKMVMVSITMHFVEVRVNFGAVCMAGIGNADAVLPDLQGIC